jgi:hypothetical protein
MKSKAEREAKKLAREFRKIAKDFYLENKETIERKLREDLADEGNLVSKVEKTESYEESLAPLLHCHHPPYSNAEFDALYPSRMYETDFVTEEFRLPGLNDLVEGTPKEFREALVGVLDSKYFQNIFGPKINHLLSGRGCTFGNFSYDNGLRAKIDHASVPKDYIVPSKVSRDE